MPYVPKTNWQWEDVVKPEDMNRIEQGIADAAAVAETAQQTATSAQQAASAAQAAAVAAQETADTALLTAQAAGQAAAIAQQTANAAQAAADAAQQTADTAKNTIDAHLADEGDPHPQYVAKSSLRNTFQDATGVTDAPATANLVAITYDGLAGLMDGRYSAANASKLAGETAAQIKAGARTLSSAPLVVEVSSSAPESPVNGQIWYDSVNHKFRGYANGAWV
ncbi:MAG: hypothetical protein FWJ65_06685 [Limnochordales bacterium]